MSGMVSVTFKHIKKACHQKWHGGMVASKNKNLATQPKRKIKNAYVFLWGDEYVDSISTELLPPEELISRIQSFGFRMFVGDDGMVHGKPTRPGLKVPFQMQPLLDQLRLQNEAVAMILKGQPEQVVLKDLTMDQAEPWLEKVKAGEYRLVGRVTYVRSTQTASFILEKVTDGG